MIKLVWGRPTARKLWLFADNGPSKIELGEALIYGFLFRNFIIGVVVRKVK